MGQGTKYPYPVFGWDRVKLAEHSLEQLGELRRVVEAAGKSPAHAAGKSIRIYTKSAEAKLDALAWAITHKLQEVRSA
jgi:hypothetical protein